MRREERRAHRAAADVALLELPEPVALCAGLVDLPERDVHEVVAVDEVAVERLAVLELYQLVERGEVGGGGGLESAIPLQGTEGGVGLPWVCFARH